MRHLALFALLNAFTSLIGVRSLVGQSAPALPPVQCTRPPKDVYTTASEAKIFAHVPVLKQYAGDAGFGLRRNVEQVRKILPEVTSWQVLEYAFCDMHRRGYLTRAQYVDLALNAAPMVTTRGATKPVSDAQRAEASAFMRPFLNRLEEAVVSDVRYLNAYAEALREPNEARRQKLVPSRTAPDNLDEDEMRRICRRIGVKPAKALNEVKNRISVNNFVHMMSRVGTFPYDPYDADVSELQGVYLKILFNDADKAVWDAIRAGDWIQSPPSFRECDIQWGVMRFKVGERPSEAAVRALLERTRALRARAGAAQ